MAGGRKEGRGEPPHKDPGGNSLAAPLLQLTPCLTQRRMARTPAPTGPGRLSLAHVSPHPAHPGRQLAGAVREAGQGRKAPETPGVGELGGGVAALLGCSESGPRGDPPGGLWARWPTPSKALWTCSQVRGGQGSPPVFSSKVLRGGGTCSAGAGGTVWAFARGLGGARGHPLVPVRPQQSASGSCVRSRVTASHLAGQLAVFRQTRALERALLRGDLSLCSSSGPRGPGAGGAGQHHLPVRAGQEDHRHLLAV